MAAQSVVVQKDRPRHKGHRQTIPGLVMVGPVVLLMLLFVITPFFLAI